MKAYDYLADTIGQVDRAISRGLGRKGGATMARGRGRRKLGRRTRSIGLGFSRYAYAPRTPGHTRRRKGKR